MTVEIDLPKIHQNIILNDSRFKVVNAGRGFAKTGILLAETVKDLATEYKHPNGSIAANRITYGAPTYKEGREIVWERAKEFLEPFRDGKPNSSRLEIPLINQGLFLIKGCDEPDSLRGPYNTKFLSDESAFHKQGYFMKIVRPMLGKVRPFGSAVFASTPNGMGEFHDFHQYGQDAKKADWKSWTYTSIEGGFMDPAEVEQARSEMTYEQWRQEYFAEFVNPANMVYYKFNRAKHHRACKFNSKYTVHWAWDFNVVPSCHSTLSHQGGDGKLYVFDEIVAGETPACVEEFMVRYPVGTVKEIKLYGDYNGTFGTTGTTDFQEIQKRLYDAGYPYPELCVYGGNPLVRSRTNNVNRLLEDANGEQWIYINTETCPKLVKDFEQVRRSEVTGKVDKTTDPTITHASDALGYQLWVQYPPAWAHKDPLPESKIQKVNSFGYWVK